MLEIYYHKAGFVPGEAFTKHARRRFRLVPVPGHPNPPQPDINLFVVHYATAQPNDQMPTTAVPYDQRISALMQQRAFVLSAGQIRHKEFMLSDRVNWPTLPELTRQQMGPQMAPRGVPQQMAYPSQAGAGPPAKRARHGTQSQPVQVDPADDDEDVWRGDMFDHMTPREISLSRYKQNHEWMEEILSSPYKIAQITPVDLGLGLSGELASLTNSIFVSPDFKTWQKMSEQSYVGRLDAGKADEFRKRVDEHIASTDAEIKKMQAEHAEALAKLKETSNFVNREKELRSIVDGAGPEAWRVEGRTDSTDDEPRSYHPGKTVEEVAKDIESETGRTIESKPNVKRIQEGGYQVPAPEPVVEVTAPAVATDMSRQPSQAESQASGILVEESDIDMGNTAAGLLDQMHTGFSSTSTPVNNFPTPQPQLSAAHSNAATPAGVNESSPVAAAAPQTGDDVSMGGIDAPAKDPSGTTPDQGTGGEDWVVVPKNDTAPDADATATISQPAAGDAATKLAAPTAKPPSAGATPGMEGGGSVMSDQNDFSSLGDLDTAGDALAGYDAPALDGSAGELGEGLDLNMDMEDSAFGDAFHGVDASGTPGEGHGQDM